MLLRYKLTTALQINKYKMYGKFSVKKKTKKSKCVLAPVSPLWDEIEFNSSAAVGCPERLRTWLPSACPQTPASGVVAMPTMDTSPKMLATISSAGVRLSVHGGPPPVLFLHSRIRAAFALMLHFQSCQVCGRKRQASQSLTTVVAGNKKSDALTLRHFATALIAPPAAFNLLASSCQSLPRSCALYVVENVPLNKFSLACM